MDRKAQQNEIEVVCDVPAHRRVLAATAFRKQPPAV